MAEPSLVTSRCLKTGKIPGSLHSGQSQQYHRDAAGIPRPPHALEGETNSRVHSEAPAGRLALVSSGQLNKHGREAFLIPKSSVLTEVQGVLSDWLLSTGYQLNQEEKKTTQVYFPTIVEVIYFFPQQEVNLTLK